MNDTTRDIAAAIRQEVIPEGAKRLGLVIGIDRYRDARLNLRCARADAEAMRNLMLDPECGLFEADNITLLADEDATRERIWRALAGLRRKAHKQDSVWIFYAGHGAPEGDAFYWVPHDGDVDDLYSTGLSRRDLNRVLDDLHAERIVAFMDCCHAAAMAAQKHKTRSVMNAEAAFGAYTGKGRLIFAASDGREKSVEIAEHGRGAFSYYLERGLRGEADHASAGVVTADGLWQYLKDKVSAAAQSAGIPQNPVRIGEETHDFALSLNPLEFGRRKRLAEAIKGMVGVGSDQLTTEEGRLCLDILRKGSLSDDDQHVLTEIEGLVTGSLSLNTVRRILSAHGRSVKAPPSVSLKPSHYPSTPNQPEPARKIGKEDAEGENAGAWADIDGSTLLSNGFRASRSTPIDWSYWVLPAYLVGIVGVFTSLDARDTSLFVIAIGILVFGTVNLLRRNSHVKQHNKLTHAIRLIDEADYKGAVEQVKSFDPSGRFATDRDAISAAAQAALDIIDARRSAELGDVESVVKLRDSNEQALPLFDEIVQCARQKAAPVLVKRAKECLAKSEYAEGVKLCRLMGNTAPFPNIYDAFREAIITEARDPADKGDVEQVKHLINLVPEDEAGKRLLEQAKKIREEQAVASAHVALAESRFQTVVRLAKNYPANQELRVMRKMAFDQGSQSLTRVRQSGELPAVERCEVSGRAYSGNIFKDVFEQCRLCGRWVQQKGSANVRGSYSRGDVWSDELACCRICSDSVIAHRRRLASERAGKQAAVDSAQATGGASAQ